MLFELSWEAMARRGAHGHVPALACVESSGGSIEASKPRMAHSKAEVPRKFPLGGTRGIRAQTFTHRFQA